MEGRKGMEEIRKRGEDGRGGEEKGGEGKGRERLASV